MTQPEKTAPLQIAGMLWMLLLVTAAVVMTAGAAMSTYAALVHDSRTERVLEQTGRWIKVPTLNIAHRIQLESFQGEIVKCLGRSGLLGVGVGEVVDRVQRTSVWSGEFDEAAAQELAAEAERACAGRVLRRIALAQPDVAAALGRLAHERDMPIPPEYLDVEAQLAALNVPTAPL